MSTISTFILQYEYVPDILEKRPPHREGHLGLANDKVKSGMCVAGGPFNPPTGAIFIFKCNDRQEVEDFVKADPYVSAGLVPSYTINELTVGVGKL